MRLNYKKVPSTSRSSSPPATTSPSSSLNQPPEAELKTSLQSAKMQFSATFLTTLLFTVTSVVGVAIPVAIPDPSPVAAAVTGPADFAEPALDAILPRQSSPDRLATSTFCTFGAYRCLNEWIVSVWRNEKKAKEE
jgi:hypothetical protein